MSIWMNIPCISLLLALLSAIGAPLLRREEQALGLTRGVQGAEVEALKSKRNTESAEVARKSPLPRICLT